MVFHTFGNEKNKVIVFIHGMLTPWQIWEDAADFFCGDYYVVIPELDGHTENEISEFISVKDEAEQIRQYLIKHFEGKVYALCGLSMGGRIAATLAGMKDVHFNCIVLDGAPLQKMPGILISVMKNSYINIIKKTKQRDPKVIERCKKDFLPERYLDDFFKVADHIQEQSVKNILQSVFSRFDYKAYSNDIRIMFMHGTKGNESVAAKSAVNLKKINPQTEIRCFDGYAHAQLACFEIEKWIEVVSAFLKKGSF